MRTTVTQDLKRILLLPLTDFKKFFTEEFYKENWHKHNGYSMLLLIPISLFLITFTGIGNANFYFAGIMWPTHYLFELFIAWAIAFAGNYLREGYNFTVKKAPWSWEDVRFGAYGGIQGRIVLTILVYVLEIVFNITIV